MKENKPTGVTVQIDAYRLEQFVRTGHPRTIGVALGRVGSDESLFEGVCIDQITIDGQCIFTPEKSHVPRHGRNHVPGSIAALMLMAGTMGMPNLANSLAEEFAELKEGLG